VPKYADRFSTKDDAAVSICKFSDFTDMLLDRTATPLRFTHSYAYSDCGFSMPQNCAFVVYSIIAGLQPAPSYQHGIAPRTTAATTRPACPNRPLKSHNRRFF
jgi:hypothetical protein